MSKKPEQTSNSGRCPVGSVGGQAVMEGVMMQSPDKIAMAVRRPDGKVVLRVRERKILSKKYPILGWPIIRGVVNFVYQLYDGMKTLTASIVWRNPPVCFTRWSNRPIRYCTKTICPIIIRKPDHHSICNHKILEEDKP